MSNLSLNATVKTVTATVAIPVPCQRALHDVAAPHVVGEVLGDEPQYR